MAASDRAGWLDSNSIIISPFTSSTFFFSPKLCGTVELTTIHGWRFLKSLLSLTLPGRSLSCCLSSPPPLSFPCTQSFGQEPATSLRQIFPGSPKAILPRFPLDLYPLPMFQIIYRRIYLLYVLVDSFGSSKDTPPPSYSFSDCICYIWFIFVCPSLSPLDSPSQSCGGGGALWRCYRKNKYDATLLSFKSDKCTVAEHQKRGREQYGVADKLL